MGWLITLSPETKAWAVFIIVIVLGLGYFLTRPSEPDQ